MKIVRTVESNQHSNFGSSSSAELDCSERILELRNSHAVTPSKAPTICNLSLPWQQQVGSEAQEVPLNLLHNGLNLP